MALAVLLLTGGNLPAHAGPPGTSTTAASTRDAATVPVHFFYSPTCPHCAKAKAFLDGLTKRRPEVRITIYELSGDGRHERLYAAVCERFKVEPPVVPLIVVGDGIFVGYDTEATSGAAIERKIGACLTEGCPDHLASVSATSSPGEELAGSLTTQPAPQVTRPAIPKSIWLPLAGDIEPGSLSLPALTLLLGAIDGFNPCAMWVLVFLIGLLMGLKDPLRMWSYGAVFLLTSGAVYFAFMAAWLNIFLFLGALWWLRVAVAALALATGVYYLSQYWRNPEGACPVTSPETRGRVMDRLRAATSNPSFAAAILGIMVLAVAVNMIELLCSAGIPAIYTQVLSMSELSPGAYYGYLSAYIAVFMLDDALVFVTAMVTLRQTGLIGTYSRASHLIGGIVLLVIGVLLLVRPQSLTMT